MRLPRGPQAVRRPLLEGTRTNKGEKVRRDERGKTKETRGEWGKGEGRDRGRQAGGNEEPNENGC